MPQAPAPLNDVRAELQDLKGELQRAADTILSAVEIGLNDLQDLRQRGANVQSLDWALCVIMAACGFQDLAGQRIERIEDILAGARRPKTSLINGPAPLGVGLDQRAVDALLGPCAARRL